MSMRIRDILDLPEHKPNVVIKVGELDDVERLRQNLVDYVITDDIARYLERDLSSIAETLEKGLPQGYARWVEGAFGSGKSHFLTFLGALLRGEGAAWAKPHPTIERLRALEGVFQKRPLLVVAVNAQDTPNLKVGLYEKTNEALQKQGLPQVELFSHERVISDFKQRASEIQGLWDYFFQKSNLVSSQEEFEHLALEDPFLLAREIAKVEGRVGELERDFQLEEAEAIRRITEHLKQHGFAGLVYLIDELTLHLLATRENAAKSLLTLNRFAEAPGARLPVWLFVGRHQPLEDVLAKEESGVIQSLDHLRGRFEPERVDLKDANLYEIVAQRVLKPRPGRESERARIVREALAQIPPAEIEELERLYQNRGDLKDWMARLYPFHPAIVDTLVSVTHRLSRERTAISILYDMLLEPLEDGKLPLADAEAGTFLPFHRAYDHLFYREYAEMHQDPTLKAARRVVVETVEERLKEVDPDRADRIRVVAKTLVLGELTDRGIKLKGKLNLPLIMALNTGALNTGIAVLAEGQVKEALRFLVERTGVFRKTGTETYEVALELEVDPEAELLRISVPNQEAHRRELLKEALRAALGFPGRQDYRDARLSYRNTERGYRVQVHSEPEVDARTLRLAPHSEVTVHVLPPGGVLNYRDQLSKGVVVWLPKELSQEAEEALDRLVRLRFALSPQAQGDLDRYAKGVQQKLKHQWQVMEEIQRERLLEGIRTALEVGQYYTLEPPIHPSPPRDVTRGAEEAARRVLEGLYPQHPHFLRSVTPKALQTLLKALAEGEVRREAVEAYEAAENIGKPLEVVVLENGAYRYRQGPLARELLRQVEEGTVRTVQDAQRFLAEAPRGLPSLVSDFLVRLLVFKGALRLRRRGEIFIPPDYAFDLSAKDVLEAGAQVDAETWQLAHEYAKRLGLQLDAAPLDLLTQDRTWKTILAHLEKLEQRLTSLRGRVEEGARFYGLSADDVGDPTAQVRAKLAPYHDLPQESKAGLEAFVREEPPSLDLKELERKVETLADRLSDEEVRRAFNEASRYDRQKAKEIILRYAQDGLRTRALDELKALIPTVQPGQTDTPKGTENDPKPTVPQSLKVKLERAKLNELAKLLGNEEIRRLEPGATLTIEIEG